MVAWKSWTCTGEVERLGGLAHQAAGSGLGTPAPGQAPTLVEEAGTDDVLGDRIGRVAGGSRADLDEAPIPHPGEEQVVERGQLGLVEGVAAVGDHVAARGQRVGL